MSRTVSTAVVMLALAAPAGAGTITVTGDAEVRVQPNEVILTFGVESMDKELTKAKTDNDLRVKRVLALAKRFAIEPKHVQTDHVDIQPKYRSHHWKSEFLGYQVRKTIVFTLRDTKKVEALVSAALEAGANYVHGVQFRTTELRKYRDKARSMALRAAKEKAVAMAAELGHEIGKPNSIREGGSRHWSWYNSGWGSRGGRYMAQNTIQNMGGSGQSSGGAIALGQITINAKVNVVFELK
jgi:uncharacterized protein